MSLDRDRQRKVRTDYFVNFAGAFDAGVAAGVVAAVVAAAFDVGLYSYQGSH